MPVEINDNFLATGDDVFSQTAAPKGRVSIWCIHNGGASDGFKSSGQVQEHGLPFGHGSNKVVKGFEIAMAPDPSSGKGKTKRNIVKGPSGREYVELHVDEESMLEKQQWEASFSNDQVKSAMAQASPNIATGDDQIRTVPHPQRPVMTDQMIDELESRQLASLEP